MAIQLKALFLALYSLLNTYIFIAGSLNKRLKVNNFCALVYAFVTKATKSVMNLFGGRKQRAIYHLR